MNVIESTLKSKFQSNKTLINLHSELNNELEHFHETITAIKKHACLEKEHLEQEKAHIIKKIQHINENIQSLVAFLKKNNNYML